MDITKKVANMRFKYHTMMIDVYNVLNQLGIVNNIKAEKVMMRHCMQTFDCLERMGFNVKCCIEQGDEG